MLADCIARMRLELGPGCVLTGEEVPKRSERDWSSAPPCRPAAFVRPASTNEMAQAVSICAQTKTRFVIQGGMTGLCGGAIPDPDGIAISTERLTGIEELDAEGSTITVKAGTPLEVVQKAADAAGFLFPLDLGARGSCTVGGNISTNAGGVRVIKYGMMRSLVLGMEAVLPDGTVVSAMNKFLKNNSGYDLKQIFIGSEGTLGVVTRAVLRLMPKPGSTMVALCSLESFDKVLALLSGARKELGTDLSAFEAMWPEFWQIVMQRPNFRSPLATRSDFHVLIEVESSRRNEDASRVEEWLSGMIEQEVVQDVAVATSLAQAQALWDVRDSGAGFDAILKAYVSYDLGMRPEVMGAFVKQCKARLAEKIPGCRSVFYGHIGDGNIHVDGWVPDQPQEAQPKEAMDSVVYGLVVEMGGIVSAEHGIGKTKRHWLKQTVCHTQTDLMATLKLALDPQNLLNPGKVV